MKHFKPTYIKFAFRFFLVLTLYYILVWSVLPFFTDPRLSQFESYRRLLNWDLRQHAIDDFDADGQKDMVSFTGCAFFSSVDTSSIPDERKCTAEGVVLLTFRNENEKIGQKYVDTQTTNFSLGSERNTGISHSYMAKGNNDKWSIYANTKEGLKKYELQSNGLLLEKMDISIFNTVDEWLYSTSSLFMLLALPLLPLTIIFTPLFSNFRSISDVSHRYEIFTLVLITIILYILWKKVEKKHAKSKK